MLRRLLEGSDNGLSPALLGNAHVSCARTPFLEHEHCNTHKQPKEKKIRLPLPSHMFPRMFEGISEVNLWLRMRLAQRLSSCFFWRAPRRSGFATPLKALRHTGLTFFSQASNNEQAAKYGSAEPIWRRNTCKRVVVTCRDDCALSRSTNVRPTALLEQTCRNSSQGIRG